MKILLIEPDIVLGEIYKEAIERAGHNVHWQKSADAAVQTVDSLGKIDLVLLELNLKSHNGVEFLYEFRSYPEWRSIPILIHSFINVGDLKISDTVRSSLGIIKHLYKPQTTLKHLISEINNLAPAPA